MPRRDSSDSLPSHGSSPSQRGSLSSSAILGHIHSITYSIQRRLSGGLSSSPSSTVDDRPPSTFFHESEPPLPSISLHGFAESTTGRILTEKFAEEIRLMMPTRLQLFDQWDLVYSLEQHGVSLATLYSRCKDFNTPRAGFVIIVRDRNENIFGAYLSDYPHVHPHYYGTGECFLFKFTLMPNASAVNLPSFVTSSAPDDHPVLLHGSVPRHHSHLHPETPTFSLEDDSQTSVVVEQNLSPTYDPARPPSQGSTESPLSHYQFKGFSYTGLNDYMILCTPQFLSVGGG